MTRDTLLKIAEGFDNVKFIKQPSFTHNWQTDLGIWKSEPAIMDTYKFKFNEFLDYLEEEQSLDKSVYILDGSDQTIYDAMTFEPMITLRLKSIYGITKKTEINEESLITNEFDKFKYLLIR